MSRLRHPRPTLTRHWATERHRHCATERHRHCATERHRHCATGHDPPTAGSRSPQDYFRPLVHYVIKAPTICDEPSDALAARAQGRLGQSDRWLSVRPDADTFHYRAIDTITKRKGRRNGHIRLSLHLDPVPPRFRVGRFGDGPIRRARRRYGDRRIGNKARQRVAEELFLLDLCHGVRASCILLGRA